MKPYRSLAPSDDAEHPIDALVARRIMTSRLQRRIDRSFEALMLALGERSDLWMKLERLLLERAAAREEAYFDTGFEHGFAAGRAEALRGQAGPRVAELAQELRSRSLNAYEISNQERVASLLLAAWSLCTLTTEPSPAPNSKEAP